MENTHKPFNWRLTLVLAALLLMLVVYALAFAQSMTETRIIQPVSGGYKHELPPVILGAHALNHGQDADMARLCQQSNGVFQVWKDKRHSNRFILTCISDTGLVFATVIEKVVTDLQDWLYREKTSYLARVKDTQVPMNWNQFMEYLSRTATRWNGPIP